MPSNNLSLGLYELSISKRTFPLTTGFCRFREGERRLLSIGDNFLQQLRRPGVSRVRGEKVAAARTEKLGTHTLTHSLTHTHTGRLLYPRYSPAAARVMTTKVLSSRPRIKCGETNKSAAMLDIKFTGSSMVDMASYGGGGCMSCKIENNQLPLVKWLSIDTVLSS